MEKSQALFGIILDALNAKKVENPLNPFMLEFSRILEKDFKEFTRGGKSLPDKVDMIDKLYQIEKDLEKLLNSTALRGKTIGAIAGGFSSGKSTFINSFFLEKTIKLATAVKPSTAIPSYVVCGKTSEIKGYNNYGAPFNIDTDIYKSITHEVLQDLGIEIRDIIPHITVSCPMDESYFKHICLIDTPGYNAPSIGSAEKDRETSASSVVNADFLIWLVGLDSTGNIQQSDFDFLKQDGLMFGKPAQDRMASRDLYIVLNNKADCKTEQELEGILNTCEEHLRLANLSWAGIHAFDPRDNTRAISKFRGKDLFSFLAEKNKPNINIESLYLPLRREIDTYKAWISGDIHNITEIDKAFAELERTVYYELRSNHSGGIDKRITSYKEKLTSFIPPIDGLKSRLEELDKIRKKFDSCFIGICREMGEKNWDPLPSFCWRCGKKLDAEVADHKLCSDPKCGAVQDV